MKVCLAATCIVVGLGALLHSSSAAPNVKQVMGIINALSLCFDVDGIHGLKWEQFKMLNLSWEEAGRMYDNIVISPKQNGFDYSAVNDVYPTREKFMALFAELFTDTAKVYQRGDILITLASWSPAQLQSLLKLLQFIMGGNDYIISLGEFEQLVAYCTGVEELTKEAKAVVALIYFEVMKQNKGNNKAWEARSVNLILQSVEALGDFLTGSELFLGHLNAEPK